MKLTIIVSDGAVYIDGCAYLDLIWNGTPENVHALQWNNNAGWLEYNDISENKSITTLPVWADAAIEAWTTAKNMPIDSVY